MYSDRLFRSFNLQTLTDVRHVVPLVLQDGATTAPVSAGGQELNQPNLSRNSQKPLWKAKQQMLALLKV